MKTLSLVLLSIVLFPNLSQACSCETGTWPLDPTEALISNARKASRYGRSSKVDAEKDIEVIKTYPSIWERLNWIHFKGTSCEVKGPNGESHFACSGRDKADYRITVHSGSQSCQMILRAFGTPKTLKIQVIANGCVPTPANDGVEATEVEDVL